MSTNSFVGDSGVTPANVSSRAVKPKRYHPALVLLHWLIAVLILGAVLLVQENEGGRERSEAGEENSPVQSFQQRNPLQSFDADEAPQSFSPAGISAQEGGQNILSGNGIHMLIGFAILILLVVRLIVRWRTPHPEWASAGNRFFDRVGNVTHWALYLLTFGMTITGIILADQRGMLARTFGIGSTSPGGFARGGFSLGFLHGGIWTLLLLLIVFHVGAALYHQFILKDNLLGRMWFGKSAE
jgi:cytochrome b561